MICVVLVGIAQVRSLQFKVFSSIVPEVCAGCLRSCDLEIVLLVFAVTPLDELWAISQSGGLIQRLTKTFQHDRSSAKPSGSAVCVQSEDLEEEWEVI